MTVLPPDQNPSIDAITSRNATRINVSFRLPGGKWARVGRVQSLTQDVANNVQALMELGSQYVVELKKGVTTFTFTIAKFYVRTDVFDALYNGAIFGLQIHDDSSFIQSASAGVGGQATAAEVLEQFNTCAINSVSRSFAQGAATIAQNATVVVAGASGSLANTPGLNGGTDQAF